MPIFSINLTRLFKQAITYVVLASLQLGTLTQVTQAYAQNAPQMAQLGAPSSAPFSGYNPDGTLYMGGQRIGNPHQVLHDAQIPAFMTITANRYTYSADPTHGQGTLAQMEQATYAGSTSSVLLNRLYLSPNNPYATTQPLGQVWPYPNYQTYQGVLLNSQQAGYLGTTAQDGKDYLFKTLTAASSQAFTILINELPNTPQFRAAADPAGGGVGVRVSQNGDAAALAAYYKTVQPYDFTWRPNAGLYTGAGNGSGQNGQLDPMYSGWANSPGGAYSGANYAEGGGAPQSFNDFIKQQQAEALANDKRVRSQTTANSLDLSNTNVNTLFGEGYNLFDYGNKANPNLAAENEYLKKLQNGEFNAGSADYNEASRIAQERYRIAYATRLESNKPLQYSVADSQRKANELNLVDTNPNKLFGDGYDLFKYDPLTNPNGAAENALLMRLQSGQLTPGTAEYDEAKSIAQQRYRNAYSNALAFNIAPKFTVAEAQRKAKEIDLSQVNPNELFGQGFDLFQYNPALRPNGEAENVLLAKLQNGELTAGSPEYLEATQIAQQRLRDAYSISLVPPEPKKVSKWKQIAGVVVGAILTFVTAGAAAPHVLSALTGISVAAAGTIITGGFLAGTFLGAVVTVGAGIVGGYVGAVISTGITTGSFSQALRAGEKVLVSGTVKGFVTTILASSLGLGGLEGIEAALGNIAVNSLSGGITQTILNGGSFGDNLKTAALDSVTEEIAKGIGEKFAGEIKNANLGDFGTELAHGALGCVTGTIRAQSGDGCAPGAAGAVAGHLAAPVIFGDTKAQYLNGTITEQQYEQARADAAFYSGVIGGGIAAGLGSTDQVNANFGLGSAAGSNAALNNALSGKQQVAKNKEIDACKPQCPIEIINKWDNIDVAQQTVVDNLTAAKDAALLNPNPKNLLALDAATAEASQLYQQLKDAGDDGGARTLAKMTAMGVLARNESCQANGGINCSELFGNLTPSQKQAVGNMFMDLGLAADGNVGSVNVKNLAKLLDVAEASLIKLLGPIRGGLAAFENKVATNRLEAKLADDAANFPKLNPHYLDRHGSNTTDAQQYERAMNGTLPNGASGKPENASRVYNNADMDSAIKDAEKLYAANPSAYTNPNTGKIEILIPFNRPVGSGYMGNTKSNADLGIPVGQKREATTMIVGIDKATKKPYTAYPDITKGRPIK